MAFAKYAGRLWSVFAGDASRKLLQTFIALAGDKVANVRLAAAANMAQALKHARLTSSVTCGDPEHARRLQDRAAATGR